MDAKSELHELVNAVLAHVRNDGGVDVNVFDASFASFHNSCDWGKRVHLNVDVEHVHAGVVANDAADDTGNTLLVAYVDGVGCNVHVNLPECWEGERFGLEGV